MSRFVGIIGMGIVGSALYTTLVPGQTICFDIDPSLGKNLKKFDLLDNLDLVYVCVPTPTFKKQEIGPVRDVLGTLVDKKYSGIVVIKSTVLYSTIQPFLNKLNIVFIPEFLNASTAIEDIKEPKLIIGHHNIELATRCLRIINEVSTINHRATYCDIEEAINFKYIRNVRNAYNVMFWEFVADIGGARKLKKLMDHFPVSENANIGQDGYHGYGQSDDRSAYDFSACLDKDIRALNSELEEVRGNTHPLLDFLDEYNSKLRTGI